MKFVFISLIAFSLNSCNTYFNPQLLSLQNLKVIKENDITSFGINKKMVINGIKVVYLHGTPFEMGYAHGKLLENEIKSHYISGWENFINYFSSIAASKQLEKYIPDEYLEELHGLSLGSGIEYEKILYYTVASSIDSTNIKTACSAFSFWDVDKKIITARQLDLDGEAYYKDMILFINKPSNGYGYAVFTVPGTLDGETGINENGITVSQNYLATEQNDLKIIPITILTRKMLQYSKSIYDIDYLLKQQNQLPKRLLFCSNKESATVFEISNNKMARIDMQNSFLALTNHARKIPSYISQNSAYRLYVANDFLEHNKNKMDINKTLILLRNGLLHGVNNRQSFIFSPGNLDFWIASVSYPQKNQASHYSYQGFNLLNELYQTGQIPFPQTITSSEKYFSNK